MDYSEDVFASFTNLGPDESLARKRQASSSVSPERRRPPPRAPQVSRSQPTLLLKRILSLPPELISLICDHMIACDDAKWILHIHLTLDACNRRSNKVFAQPILSESLEEVLHGAHPTIYSHLSTRAAVRFQVTERFIHINHSAIHQLIFHLPNYNPVTLTSAVKCQEWECCMGSLLRRRPSPFVGVATFILYMGQSFPPDIARLAQSFITRFDEIEDDGTVITVEYPWCIDLPMRIDRYQMGGVAKSWVRHFDRSIGRTTRLGVAEHEQMLADIFPDATSRVARQRQRERHKPYFYVTSQGRVLKCEPKGEERMNEIVREDGEMRWHGYQDNTHVVW